MIRNRARSAVSPTTPPVANGQLTAIVERIEKLDAERKAKSADIREVYTEAKSKGYNVKALRKVARERRQDNEERAEIDMAMEAYREGLGMVAHAVGNGEMSVRQAEEVSGFSRSAIHREVSHRKEIAVSGTADVPTATADDADEVSHRKEVPFSGTPAIPQVDADDGLAIPAHLDRRQPSP